MSGGILPTLAVDAGSVGRWQVLVAYPSLGGLHVEGVNRNNGERFSWSIGAASLEAGAWQRYDWMMTEFRNVDAHDCKHRFSVLAGISINDAREWSRANVPFNAPVAVPLSVLMHLVNVALRTAESHDVHKLVSDPSTRDYIEVQLLKATDLVVDEIKRSQS